MIVVLIFPHTAISLENLAFSATIIDTMALAAPDFKPIALGRIKRTSTGLLHA
jgi:hypothetical protein